MLLIRAVAVLVHYVPDRKFINKLFGVSILLRLGLILRLIANVMGNTRNRYGSGKKRECILLTLRHRRISTTGEDSVGSVPKHPSTQAPRHIDVY